MRIGERRYQLRFVRPTGAGEWACTARGLKRRFVTVAAAKRHLAKLIAAGIAKSGKVSDFRSDW